MHVTVTQLAPHPNDPVGGRGYGLIGPPAQPARMSCRVLGPRPQRPNEQEPAMTDQLPDPRLSKVYRLEATLGQPLDLGDIAQGHRRIVPLSGGRFTGPELNGELLPGSSADWQIVLPDGTALGDIRYTLQTDGGDLLYVQSRGVRHGSAEVVARLARGEDVDASGYTFPHLNSDRDRRRRSRLAQQRCLHQRRRPAGHRRDLRDLPRRMIPSTDYDKEKVAIITGASQGIGTGLTTAYLELGYAVIAGSPGLDARPH
jgi:hypothetical protein